MQNKKVCFKKGIFRFCFLVILLIFSACDPKIDVVDVPLEISLADRSGVTVGNTTVEAEESKELVVWQNYESGEKVNVTAEVQWDDIPFGRIEVLEDKDGSYVVFKATGDNFTENIILTGTYLENKISIKVKITNPIVSLEFAHHLFEMDYKDNDFFLKVNAKLKNGDIIAASSRVHFSVSKTGIVSISEDLKVSAKAPGEVTITAHDKYIPSLKVSNIFTVNNPIDSIIVSPPNWDLLRNESKQLEAQVYRQDGTLDSLADVEWESFNSSIAEVDSNGLVSSKDFIDSIEIFAKCGLIVGSARIEIRETNVIDFYITSAEDNNQIAINVFEQTQFEAWAIYRNSHLIPVNVTEEADWESSQISVASISLEGVALGNQKGLTNISANYDIFESQEIVLNILDPPVSILVSPQSFTMNSGDSREFSASVTFLSGIVETPVVNWSSSKESLVQINPEGQASGAGGGTADIIASYENITGTAELSILPWYDIQKAAHMPDCLEMPYRPEVYGAGRAGEKGCDYYLGGSSCLAGDFIKDYSFSKPLQIGDKIVFKDMMHYTMVKTNMFNGINLPSIYILEDGKNFDLIRTFSYNDYKSRL